MSFQEMNFYDSLALMHKLYSIVPVIIIVELHGFTFGGLPAFCIMIWKLALLFTRLYLRMLISIPGDPLRRILGYGDKRIEEANASQYNTVSSHPSSQATQVSFSCSS